MSIKGRKTQQNRRKYMLSEKSDVQFGIIIKENDYLGEGSIIYQFIYSSLLLADVCVENDFSLFIVSPDYPAILVPQC